jgi:hypothetical protein
MKHNLLASILLASGLTVFGNHVATASDELGGALLGAGAGAVVGHVIGGRDAAIVGGFLGAVIGAAAADDDDDRVVVRHPHRGWPVHHGVLVYEAPRPRHAPPPVWVAPRRGHEYRDHDRHGWDDGYGRRGDGRWDRRDW